MHDQFLDTWQSHHMVAKISPCQNYCKCNPPPPIAIQCGSEVSGDAGPAHATGGWHGTQKKPF